MNDEVLQRIATALERIADHLDGRHSAWTHETQEKAQSTPEVQTLTEDASPIEEYPFSVKNHLMACSVYIKTLPQPEPADEVLDKLSNYLGDRYKQLSDLLVLLKRHTQSGQRFTLSLKSMSQDAVSSNCQFCSFLHNLAMLTYYRYDRSPTFLITAAPTTQPTFQKFINGHWLERYVRSRVMTYESLIADCLMNPQVILPNGDDFELDIFAVSKVGKPLWIEAKTGEYQTRIAKYGKLASVLGLKKDEAFLVVPDLSEKSCRSISAVNKLQVVNIELLNEALGQFFERT